MTDIVSELRSGSEGWSGDAACVSCEVAERGAVEIESLRGALLAACNYIELALPNLGRKASSNYHGAAIAYRKIAAGEMLFSDLKE